AVFAVPPKAGGGKQTAGQKWRTIKDSKDGVSLDLPSNWFILKPSGYSKGKPPAGAVEPKREVNPLFAEMNARWEASVHIRAVHVYRDRHGKLHRVKFELSGRPATMTDGLKTADQQVSESIYATKKGQSLEKEPHLRVNTSGGRAVYYYEYLAKNQSGDWAGPSDVSKVRPIFEHIVESITLKGGAVSSAKEKGRG
ncbi:MAG: hypothetical protein P8Z49_12395, partial [Acidobacteriota bacterium]